MSVEDTLHLDGLRPKVEVQPDQLRIMIQLVIGGEIQPQPIPFMEVPRSPRNDALVDQVFIMAQALCTYITTGGSLMMLTHLVNRFIDQVPALEPQFRLVSVLPPPGGNMVIWQKPDGTYLKSQEGPEGFVDPLTEDELKEVLIDHLDSAPEPPTGIF